MRDDDERTLQDLELTSDSILNVTSERSVYAVRFPLNVEVAKLWKTSHIMIPMDVFEIN